jgi:hypothetical protein
MNGAQTGGGQPQHREMPIPTTPHHTPRHDTSPRPFTTQHDPTLHDGLLVLHMQQAVALVRQSTRHHVVGVGAAGGVHRGNVLVLRCVALVSAAAPRWGPQGPAGVAAPHNVHTKRGGGAFLETTPRCVLVTLADRGTGHHQQPTGACANNHKAYQFSERAQKRAYASLVTHGASPKAGQGRAGQGKGAGAGAQTLPRRALRRRRLEGGGSGGRGPVLSAASLPVCILPAAPGAASAAGLSTGPGRHTQSLANGRAVADVQVLHNTAVVGGVLALVPITPLQERRRHHGYR